MLTFALITLKITYWGSITTPVLGIKRWYRELQKRMNMKTGYSKSVNFVGRQVNSTEFLK